MVRALDGLTKLREREKKVKVVGNREFNPGWHTAMDLHSLLTVSEAVFATRRLAAGVPMLLTLTPVASAVTRLTLIDCVASALRKSLSAMRATRLILIVPLITLLNPGEKLILLCRKTPFLNVWI